MAYATYEQYQTVYFGNAIPEADFPRLAERASEYIDSVTFNRLREDETLITNDVIKCACAIAETINASEQSSVDGIGDIAKTSETVGGYSVSYALATGTDGHTLSKNEKNNAIARQYLGHTGLMYRGR